ncbi:MAG: glycosyltransferase [Propionibacteriaceae bacterium]|nr:glycosyltransferase [Propionibacteriaceae bacterium]
MRIAQLANFVSQTSDGLKRSVDALGEGYAQSGHTRLLVVPGAQDCVSTSSAGTVVTIASPLMMKGDRVLVNMAKVRRVLEQFSPTNVEVSDRWMMTWAAKWATRRQIPSVLLSHDRMDDMLSFSMELDVAGQIHFLNRRLARHYDRIVVTTRYSAGEWINTKANLMVQPWGVDLEEFSPVTDRGISHGPLTLVYAGALSREKSPHLAVATAVELDRRGVDVQLHVYGTGPHFEELRTLAGGAPVFFHGYLESRAALSEAYTSADIALSVCPVETFGLTALEALACGTPVVVADRGGAREVVDPCCAGWASPDPVFLADAVLNLAERLREDEQAMRMAARKHAENYPWQASIDAMLTLHESLLTHSSTPMKD